MSERTESFQIVALIAERAHLLSQEEESGRRRLAELEACIENLVADTVPAEEAEEPISTMEADDLLRWFGAWIRLQTQHKKMGEPSPGPSMSAKQTFNIRQDFPDFDPDRLVVFFTEEMERVHEQLKETKAKLEVAERSLAAEKADAQRQIDHLDKADSVIIDGFDRGVGAGSITGVGVFGAASAGSALHEAELVQLRREIASLQDQLKNSELSISPQIIDDQLAALTEELLAKSRRITELEAKLDAAARYGLTTEEEQAVELGSYAEERLAATKEAFATEQTRLASEYNTLSEACAEIRLDRDQFRDQLAVVVVERDDAQKESRRLNGVVERLRAEVQAFHVATARSEK